jgi:phage baseplate assembly protein W
MKTITVNNGDIQLNNGKIQFSTGNNKLVQDLALWLEEPLGTGYTTPGFGSLLANTIGQGQTAASASTAQAEIARVLQLYQGQQVLDLQTAQNSSQLSNWNKSEIIQNIISIDTMVQGTSIVANVVLQTLQNNPINLTISINNNGVSVQNG